MTKSEVESPDGKVRFELQLNEGRVRFSTTSGGRAVIEASPLVFTLDGVDLTAGVVAEGEEAYDVNETYAWLGAHSHAVNLGHGVRIALRHAASDTRYELEVRAYDDGVAFRIRVPGEGLQRVPDEATTFRLPVGSAVWYHDFEGHYEGAHARKAIAAVPEGAWAAPPLTVKLPGGAGYAAITEAALANYAGMGLQSDGQQGFTLRLGHAHPPSYPFTLRYGDEEALRLSRPAAVAGGITTPWRVVIIGADLNALVNADIVPNLCPPPDEQLFPEGPHTGWVRPGRAVWKYLDGGENTIEEMKAFCRLAGELGFEHHVVEGFWRRWRPEELRELVECGRTQGVGIWLWKHSKELRDAPSRREFYRICREAGAVGCKIDFFDHEAKEVIDLYQTLLRETAENQLLVNFHGANKPTGEARTWPHELTREGVKGMEYRRFQERAQHDTTLPFTRWLAGHADYTPVLFSERRGDTTWAHQIASAAILTAPLLTYGAHPRALLTSRAAAIIKSLPSVWDETIVLPPSEIGEIAAFARRSGETWFLAILNGPTGRSVDMTLSFLGEGDYQMLLVRDDPNEAAAVEVEESVATRDRVLSISMRDGGGFVARLVRSSVVQSWKIPVVS